MKKSVIIIAVIFLLLLTYTIIAPYMIHGTEEVISINHNGNILAGSLYIPKKSNSFPLVILIHGDGASDRTEGGAYTMIINAFLDNDIACFSHDKPGIGLSEGSWLNQSMRDRADEAITIKSFLSKDPRIEKTGYLGLSQGGWVLSEIAMVSNDFDFMMLIGGAIDWMTQGAYYEEMFLNKSDMTEKEKESYRITSDMVDDFLFHNKYDEYRDYLAANNLLKTDFFMSRERFHFVNINMNSNAEKGIYYIDKPFLGLFGEMDMNVDSVESFNTYQRILKEAGNDDAEIYLIEGANHGLLKFRYENAAEKPLLMLEMFLRGKKVYAENALEILENWSTRYCR